MKQKTKLLICMLIIFIFNIGIFCVESKCSNENSIFIDDELGKYEITYRTHSYISSSSSQFLQNQVGRTGNDALKIISNDYSDCAYILTINNLDPNEFYQISAYAKVNNIDKQNNNYGANICEDGSWVSSHQILENNSDWERLEVILRSNADGIIYLNLRLGFWNALTKGEVTFDDINIEKITDSSETKMIIRSDDGIVRIVLDKNQYEISGISDAKAKEWANTLSVVRSYYADLVGKDAYNGKVDIVCGNYYPAYAIAGDPIQWLGNNQSIDLNSVENDDNLLFGILHEIGHNYDLEDRWNFDGEMFANLKMVYPLEKINGKVIMQYEYSGAEIKEYYKKTYDKTGLSEIDGVVYKLIDIKDIITQKTEIDGWETYKSTFRYFNDLNPSQVPETIIGKFKLFIEKLSDFSGINIIDEFTREEWQQIVEHYGGKVATQITIDKTSVDILLGQEFKINATVTPLDAIYTNPIFISQDESIVTVDENGTIVPQKVGTTTIDITTKDKSSMVKMTVNVKQEISDPIESENTNTEKDNTDNNSSVEQEDNTTFPNKLPATGINAIILIVIAILFINAMIMFINYKKININ